jgi:lysophospholipase L1-like esterase
MIAERGSFSLAGLGLLGVVALVSCTSGGGDSTVGDDAGADTGVVGAGGSGGSSSGGQPGTGGVVATGGNGTGGLATGGGGGQARGGQGGVASGGAAGHGSGGLGAAGHGSGGAGGMRTGGASGSGAGGVGGGAAGKTGGAGAGGRAGGSGTGGTPATGGVGAAGATGNITIWIAGDSTVANGSTPCPIGWAAQFLPHFNSKVTVSNRAIGGRSVQTWLYDVSSTLGTDGECVLNSTTYQAAWTAMLTGMKAGDYLFIQFGINDTDSTCPRHVGTALFKTDYGMMAQAAKDRGANPIFVTPVSSIACSGSKATPTRGTFATATIQAGTQYNVPVIDLEQLSVALYTSLGFCPLPGADTATTFESGAIGDFFCEDHTHFEQAGAVQIADLVAKALVDQGLGLAAYLK